MKLSSATDAKAVRAAAESAAEPRILASDTEKRSDRSVRSPQIEGRNRGTEQEWRARVVARTRNTRPPLHAPLRYTLCMPYSCIYVSNTYVLLYVFIFWYSHRCTCEATYARCQCFVGRHVISVRKTGHSKGRLYHMGSPVPSPGHVSKSQHGGEVL